MHPDEHGFLDPAAASTGSGSAPEEGSSQRAATNPGPAQHSAAASAAAPGRADHGSGATTEVELDAPTRQPDPAGAEPDAPGLRRIGPPEPPAPSSGHPSQGVAKQGSVPSGEDTADAAQNARERSAEDFLTEPYLSTLREFYGQPHVEGCAALAEHLECMSGSVFSGLRARMKADPEGMCGHHAFPRTLRTLNSTDLKRELVAGLADTAVWGEAGMYAVLVMLDKADSRELDAQLGALEVVRRCGLIVIPCLVHVIH